MEIRNTTQFASFLRGNGFQVLDGMFLQVVNCIDNYSAACNCYKEADKRFIYETCCKLYETSVRHLAPQFRNQFLSKTTDRQISFYTDSGVLITVMSR